MSAGNNKAIASVLNLTLRELVPMLEEIRGKRPVSQSQLNNLLENRPQFRPKSLKILSLDISAAITDANAVKRGVSGTFLQYITSTNPTDVVRVRYGSGQGNDFMPWQPGNGLLGWPFDELWFSVPTAITTGTAYFLYSQVDPDEAVRFI
jgi:hypothetical protein